MNSPVHDRGFSLVETLVATTLLAVAVGGLAQLSALATRTNQGARSATTAALLAASKAEDLGAQPWDSLSAMATLDDDSLDTSTPGLHDRLNAAGMAFTRRWSVQRLLSDPDNVLVLQVVVLPSGWETGEARIATVRARRDWWDEVEP